MNLLVTGSRTYDDHLTVDETLTGIYVIHSVGWQSAHLSPLVLIHGGAPGADSLADTWAKTCPLVGPHYFEVPTEDEMWEMKEPPIVIRKVDADWQGPCDPEFCKPVGHRRPGWNHGPDYCPAAGLRRNQRMIDEYAPHRAVAFVDKSLPKSKGTRDMVSRLGNAGIPTRVVRT